MSDMGWTQFDRSEERANVDRYGSDIQGPTPKQDLSNRVLTLLSDLAGYPSDIHSRYGLTPEDKLRVIRLLAELKAK